MLRGCSSTLGIDNDGLDSTQQHPTAFLPDALSVTVRALSSLEMSFDRNPASPIAAQDTEKGGPKPPRTRLGTWVKAIPEGYVVPISGGLAGAVSGLVSCPLDVIKTKLQAQGGFRASEEGVKITTAAYRGVQGTAGTIWKEEGLRGMYRGLGPMLLGYVPTWAVYLTVYNKSQAYFRTKTGELNLHAPLL